MVRTSLFSIAFVLFAAGCATPEYPNCDNDQQCREGEFCVNGLCQQCRTTEDCREGTVCQSGRCDPIPGYCQTSRDCAGGRVCKANRCVPCETDGECDSGVCRAGVCLEPGQCASDADCPQNYECQDGICMAPPPDTMAAGCRPETVYFGFDEYTLTPAAAEKLKQALSCVRSVPGRTLRLEGHCDPRGTEEYNLALGERRAQSVAAYLRRLGIPNARIRTLSRGKLEATGFDERTWAKDRKVEFVWE